LYDIFSSENFLEAMFTLVLNEPAAFIPQFASQIASFTDEYKRTTYESGDAFQSAINKMLIKIPGLRKTLPKQVNVLGEDVENLEYHDIWFSFFSPYSENPKTSGDVAEEVYRLYKETGEKTVIPNTAPNYFTVKGTKISFTAEEKANYQRSLGKTSFEILDKMLNSSEYKKLSESEKAEAVKKVYDYATKKAKADFKYNYDYELLSEMVGKDKSGKPILTEEKYNRLDDKAKQILINEYYLSDEQIKCKGDVEKLAELFIKKAKE
jgi:hypothetical protein